MMFDKDATALRLKNMLIERNSISFEELEKDFGKEILDSLLKDMLIGGMCRIENGSLKVIYAPEDEKPDIFLPHDGRLISEFADELGGIFKDKNIMFFRPVEDAVVRLEMIPTNDGKERMLGFHEMKKSEFVTFIEKYTSPMITIVVKKKGEDPEFIDKERSMRGDVADITLCSHSFRQKIPIIDKIYNAPMPILKDGNLTFPRPRYDKKLWSWMPLDAPNIDPNMPLEDAVELIRSIYSEFCFKSDQDKTVAYAGLITPFLRGLYARETCRTPLIFYLANRERAGKDFCAGITGIVYNGVADEEPPFNEEEEFRKRVMANFKKGKTRIHMSNFKGHMDSPQLEMLITAETWTDRQLGSNINSTYPNTLEMSISANTGITYTPDIANRSVFVNLFLDIENPNERMFVNPNLHGWIKEHRSEILSALYALVRNWHELGMPPGTHPFASFPEWARVCGGVMEAAGLGNPCVPNIDQNAIGGDDETKEMKTLFELCFDKWNSNGVLKTEIIDEIMRYDTIEPNPFNELFGYMKWTEDPKSARTRFGIKLDKFLNRWLSGIRMYVDNMEKRACRRKYMWSKEKEETTTQATLQVAKKLE